MRNVKRLLILLMLIAVTAITFSTVGQMIGGTLTIPIGVGFTLFGLVILSFVIASFSKRRISFTRIYLVLLFSGLFVLISCAYLDINSYADIKNSITSAFSTEKGNFRSNVDLVVQRVELKLVEISEDLPDSVESGVEEPIKDSDFNNGKKVDEETQESATTKHVHVGYAVIAGADGHLITLNNNPDAVNPSWNELTAFLLNDKTDSLRYDFDTFVCADFAEELHNNAENAGIRTAFVAIRLGPCSYFPFTGGHALNAFETTDRGLVFVDCTSSNQWVNADKIVNVEVGKDYIPTSIFPEPGWDDVWFNMGEVLEIEVIEW